MIGFYSQGLPRREVWFIDDEPIGEFKFEPNRLETTIVQIPYESYVRDRRVEVTFRNASGPFTAKAGLMLICVDHKHHGGGGQSGGREAKIVSRCRIGPNPTTGKLFINFHLDKPAPVKISLFDLTGRRIAALYDSKIPSGKQRLTLTLPERLSSGIYFLIFEAEGRRASKKVVLRR